MTTLTPCVLWHLTTALNQSVLQEGISHPYHLIPNFGFTHAKAVRDFDLSVPFGWLANSCSYQMQVAMSPSLVYWVSLS